MDASATIDRSERIAVIGGGPGGLSAARWLRECGVGFDLLERHADFGGIWDIDAPGSPMYETAHFISSKTLSAFRDAPLPDAYPDYPSHRQILEYLRAYAEQHRLRDDARFGARVAQVAPDASGEGWRVTLQGGEARRYAGVVLAIGQQWTPKQPALPGSYSGEVRHASAYRSIKELEGRRVLVVGGGNSGCDIAVDAGIVAKRALLSLRRGYWFIPKHIFGMPADVFGQSGPHLSARVEQILFQPLLRLLVGDLRRFGLRRPDHRLFETHPVLNSQILHSLSHGDVTAKPDVRAFDGQRATFADGSSEEIDLVILATGYRKALSLLPESLYREGDVSSLFLNVFHRQHAGLAVVGFFETDGGSFPVIDRQSELIAKLWRARRESKQRLSAFERALARPAPDLGGGVRYLAVERMANYVRMRPYVSYLEELARTL